MAVGSEAKLSFTFAGAIGTLTQIMGSYDLNTWGIYAMPLGVLLCFGPALLVWIRAELRSAAEERRMQEPKPVVALKAPHR